MIVRSVPPSLWQLLVGGGVICLLAAQPLIPAEPADEVPRSAARADSDGDQPTGSGAVDGESKKRETISFALVMLAGIILGGAMLLVLVVVWGNRARRLARHPLPPVAKRDELWFLKPKKDFGEGPGGVTETGPEPEPDTK